MADDDFKIAGAYVEVNLRDSTAADEKSIRGRIEGEPALTLDTKLSGPDNLAAARAKTQSELDVDPLKIPAKLGDPVTVAWKAKLEADLNGLAKESLKIPVTPDNEKFRTELSAKLAELKATVHGDIPIEPADLADFHLKLDAAVKEASAGITAKIPAKVDKDDPELKKSAQEAGSGAGLIMGAGIATALPLAGAAMVAGVATLGVALAVMAEKYNFAVRAAFVDTANTVMHTTKDAAAQVDSSLVDSAARLGSAYAALGPQLHQAFAPAGPDIQIFTSGIIQLVDNLMPGFLSVMRNSQPVVQGVAHVLADVGTAGTNALTGLSSHAQEFGTVLDQAGTLVTHVGSLVGSVLPTMNAGFSTTIGTVTGMVSALSAMGPELGAVAGYAPDVVLGFKAFGAISPQLDKASTGLSNMAKNMSTTTSAGKVMQSGVSGLAGVIGSSGALGVAIGGALVLLTALGHSEQQAAQAAREQSDAAMQTAQVMRENNNVISLTSKTQEAAALQGQDWVKALMSQGVTLREVTDAAMGVPGALQKVQEQVGQLGGAGSAADNILKSVSGGLLSNGDAANKAKDALGILDGVYQQATEDNKQFKGAVDDTTQSFGPLAFAGTQASSTASQLADSIATLADKSQSASSMLSALQQEIHLVAEGGKETANDAIEAMYKAVDQLASSLKGAKGPLLDAAGNFDLASAKGQNARDAFKSITDQMAAYAQALNNQHVPAAQMQDDLQKQLDQLAGPLAKQLGLSTTQVETLFQKEGLIPKDIVSQISTPGMPQAFSDFDTLARKVGALPPNTSMYVTGLTQDAAKAFSDLGYQVTQLKNGTWVITVGANTGPAMGAAQRLVQTISGMTAQLTIQGNVVVKGGGSVGPRMSAMGNLFVPNAEGNILRYDDGGMPGLTPMAGGMATVVPPDTWRVVGDNMTVPELYAPLNGSARTKQLITEAAVNQGVSTGGSTYAPVVNNNITVRDNESAQVMASAVAAQTSWDLRAMRG